MTAAVRTIIHEWMIPRMNAHSIRVEMFKGNQGSVRVFEKNGFVLTDTTIADETAVNSMGIVRHGSHVMWWRLGEQP